MKISTILSDALTLEELGARARQQRIARNLTQSQLAEMVGVSTRTVERFEGGTSIQLDTLLRILRGIGLFDQLDRLLPEETVRPLAQLEGRPVHRQRASPARVMEAKAKGKGGWVWGDKR